MILAFSSTLANTAETTCAGDCVLLNAVVLKLSSYSRPPGETVSQRRAALAVFAGRRPARRRSACPRL